MPREPKGERRPANASSLYASKPAAAFKKLAVMLRNVAAVRWVFVKFAALLRGNGVRGEPLTSDFFDEAPGVTRNAVDEHAAVLEPSSSHEIAAPETNHAPGVTRNAVDEHAAVLEPSSSHEIAAPETHHAPGVTRNAVDEHAAVLEPSSSNEIAAPETNHA